MVRGRNPLGRPQVYPRLPNDRTPLYFNADGSNRLGPDGKPIRRPVYARKNTGGLLNIGMVATGPGLNIPGIQAKLDNIFLDVNKRTLTWMQDRATRELKKSIKERGRPPRGRSGRLEATINDPRVSFYNEREVDFFIYKNAAALAPYWRAIEEGSSYHSARGTVVPVTIQAGNNRYIQPDLFRQHDLILKAPKGRQNNQNVEFITVRRPIPAYRYLERARTAFKAQSVYYRYLAGARGKLAKIAPAGVTIDRAAGTRRPSASIF